MKKNKGKSKKMPPHTFTVVKAFTYDRLYNAGESIVLNHCETVENLLNKKIIK